MVSTPLAPYPSPEAREIEFESLVERSGGEIVRYGQSSEGRELRAARLPASRPDANLRLLCSANTHGLEYIGGRVALALLAACQAPPPPLTRLRSRAELWIIPCINPDGYARTWSRGGDAPSLGQLRANARGVDLNRNWPRPGDAPPSWIPGTGSDRPGDPTYRGPHALSEPETADLDALLRRIEFHASVNMHSFMGTVIPARVTDRTRFRGYSTCDGDCNDSDGDRSPEDGDGDGYTTCAGDCDDGNPLVSPGTPEVVADGIDQDCDLVDHCFVDQDRDGQGGGQAAAGDDLICGNLPGEATTSTDCDDLVPTTYLGAPEVVGDGVDQDCDGFDTCYGDTDGTASGACSRSSDWTSRASTPASPRCPPTATTPTSTRSPGRRSKWRTASIRTATCGTTATRISTETATGRPSSFAAPTCPAPGRASPPAPTTATTGSSP